MRDVHSMKKAIHKLLQEIETLKKEFDKIPTDKDLKTLNGKMEDSLMPIRYKTYRYKNGSMCKAA